MLILNERNETLDAKNIKQTEWFSVLRLRDLKDPDFYFEEITVIEEFSSHTVKLQIGDDDGDNYTVFVPINWSILCSDMEYVQTIPLCEFSGRDFYAFCINPIDGYMPHYKRVRIVGIQESAVWRSPPIQDKDMLVSPIGYQPRGVARGPLCAILSPNKLDIHLPISDII